MCTTLPTAFNEIIGLAKATSNVYILALPELFYTIQIIWITESCTNPPGLPKS
jgi:polar amino acid transport system permease protein